MSKLTRYFSLWTLGIPVGIVLVALVYFGMIDESLAFPGWVLVILGLANMAFRYHATFQEGQVVRLKTLRALVTVQNLRIVSLQYDGAVTQSSAQEFAFKIESQFRDRVKAGQIGRITRGEFGKSPKRLIGVRIDQCVFVLPVELAGKMLEKV